MKPIFKPGDRIRLFDPPHKSPYPLLASLIAEAHEGTFVVETSTWSLSHETPFAPRSGYETIRVRWPDGKLSGALYADIFERAEEDAS